MRRIVIALAALILLRADMYPDASNAKLPEAQKNLGMPTTPQMYGAKCDVRSLSALTPATWAAGGTSFTPSNGITPAASDIGKKLVVYGAGTAGSTYVGTITAAAGSAWTVSPAISQASGITLVYGIETITTPQSGAGSYAPNDTITLAGGTIVSPAALKVTYTKLVSATVAAGGTTSLGNGTYTAGGTTGFGHYFQVPVTVTGGTVTAVGTPTTAGAYEANPTTLAAEPIQLIGGAGLTGTTLNLKMGVAQVTIQNPGGYSGAGATGARTQASTSGAGTGFAVTVVHTNQYMPGHYGQWHYGTDDSAAFAAAVAWAQANQSAVRLSGGVKCGIGSTIQITGNLVELSGESSGVSTGEVGATTPLNSALYWMGAQDQPIVQIRTPDGGTKLTGVSVKRLALIAANRAGAGLRILSASHGTFEDLYIEQATQAGLDLGTNTNVSVSDTQYNNFTQLYLRQMGANGHMIRLDGDNTIATGSASGNFFQNVHGNMGQATGIYSRYADGNSYKDVAFGPVYSTALFGVDFACKRDGVNPGFCSYGNKVDYLGTGTSSVIARGVTSSGIPTQWSLSNEVKFSGDASATPILEPRAQLTYSTTYSEHGLVTAVKLISGFLPNGQGYEQRDIMNNTTASQAHGGDMLFTGGASQFIGFNVKYRTDIGGYYYHADGGAVALSKTPAGCFQVSTVAPGTAGTAAAVAPQMITCPTLTVIADLAVTQSAPASPTAACTTGTIKPAVDHIYVCTATNTWKRAALVAY